MSQFFQLSIMKAAGYAQTSDSRKANILIKNVDLTKEAIEEGDLADRRSQEREEPEGSRARLRL